MNIRLAWINRLLTSLVLSSLILHFLADAKADIEKRCATCRSIANSFNEGIERTARLNFEGGDTDWEEKKLGSYSTSETRFIEILETLCKRTEYECNVFVEEAEEFLEEWWKDHGRDNENLENWLCIEKTVVCCPRNRYGPDCEVCVGGEERPCTGNGYCKGSGTRGGNGKCKCHGGYKGDLCDVCKKGFYEAHKNETDVDCKACDPSCSSTCSGPGPTACTKCKGGYLWDEELGCQDIDECKLDIETYPCQKQEYCENNPGSYKCGKCDIACTECLGPSNDKCVACREGFSMVDNICKDVDECEQDPCGGKEHMKCDNSPGSYFCECEEGYISDGEKCVDKSLLTGDDSDAGDTENNSEESQKQQLQETEENQSHDSSPDTAPAGQESSEQLQTRSEEVLKAQVPDQENVQMDQNKSNEQETIDDNDLKAQQAMDSTVEESIDQTHTEL